MIAIVEMVKSSWKVAVTLIIAVMAAYLSLRWLPKDNPIEQLAEEIIKEETGVTIDLTP